MQLIFRSAKHDDLNALVNLLADDELGATREDSSLPLNPKYQQAFAQISLDPNNQLVVVEADRQVVGMLQLTFIPYLTHIGSRRCLIEGVRIHAGYRGQGLGKQFFEWAIQRAKDKGCNLIQLTSDKSRPGAIYFYQKLGFTASHEGFKRRL